LLKSGAEGANQRLFSADPNEVKTRKKMKLGGLLLSNDMTVFEKIHKHEVRTPPVKHNREDLMPQQIIQNPSEKVLHFMDSTKNKKDKNVLKKFAFATLAGTRISDMGPATLK